MKSSSSRWAVVALLVVAALGTGCGTGFNNSPLVTEGPMVSSRDVASGDEVQMHLVVTDKDGDPLVYNWLQEPLAPAGSFSDVTVREPSWVAPEVSSPRTFVLKVTIKDPENATLISWTSILVHPR
ncbi:hypothetical protein [Hyalangium gracile]|uniref:hypothetical protein n=1 Tax=Hyalangium gracile TaxID=394092 RepID=UPI001CCB2178|nr:hypothetical protein [Hyalangium gracile]